jgi:hypothetical protein
MFSLTSKPFSFEFYPHTPDAATLEESEHQLLFVCDTMMSNRIHFPKIKDHSEVLWRGFTYDSFTFFQRTLPGQVPEPIPLRIDTALAPRVKVFGEVHLIKSKFIKELDFMKVNRVQFERQRVKVIIPGRWRIDAENKSTDGKPLPKVLLGKKGLISPEEVYVRKMWMYVGRPECWEPLIDGGYFFQKVAIKLPYQSKSWLGDKYYLFE